MSGSKPRGRLSLRLLKAIGKSDDKALWDDSFQQGFVKGAPVAALCTLHTARYEGDCLGAAELRAPSKNVKVPVHPAHSPVCME